MPDIDHNSFFRSAEPSLLPLDMGLVQILDDRVRTRLLHGCSWMWQLCRQSPHVRFLVSHDKSCGGWLHYVSGAHVTCQICETDARLFPRLRSRFRTRGSHDHRLAALKKTALVPLGTRGSGKGRPQMLPTARRTIFLWSQGVLKMYRGSTPVYTFGSRHANRKVLHKRGRSALNERYEETTMVVPTRDC